MNEKISRNDPCPCGSGKKYKKCCGANEAVTITHILDKEIDELQKQILQFAVNHYDIELEDSFEEFEETLLIPNEEIRDFYSLIHAIWFTLFQPLEDGKTILEKFIAYEGKRIQRPKLRQILQTWTSARAIAGEILSISGNVVTFEEGFTGKKIEAVLITEAFPVTEGNFFLGIILPYEQRYVFFPGPFDLAELSAESALDHIEDFSLQAGYDDPLEYVQDFFLETISELPMLRDGDLDIESLEWPAPVYQEVAEIFQESLEAFNEDPVAAETGILLWYQFCQKRQKRIKNPNLYAAALHYLVSTIVPMDSMMTQKELAEHYEVSTGSISPVYQEMDRILLEELSEMEMPDYHEPFPAEGRFPNSILTERVMREALAELEGRDFESIEEANRLINEKLNAPKKAPKGNKERAQQMIYDAFEAEGPLRYRLAKDALKLDPNCVDAYNILAEAAPSMEEAASMYEKGMVIGERQLGKKFFTENRGYFWGLYETRPFMRAKFNYAQTLFQLGKRGEAISQMAELLELNPVDNQGVRFFLFIAYVDNGELEKARNLLDEFDEGFARGTFNRALLEILEHGFTAKAAKIMKEAKKENKHVIPYLLGKKRIPSELPSYYQIGDENEAIIYADDHLHLWRKIPGVTDWLKKL
ncbi:SEC-C metal-binding domain-containing protein [Bacillota bacterium Lsc_1132]